MQLDKEAIKNILPHRDPMLLVDTVEEMQSGSSITTTFYIDPAREIFKGHFPGDPVFPGVYSVECMAQAVDIMVMTNPVYQGKVPLFLGINNVRFRKKIAPGDTLTCKAMLASERPEKAIITCTAEGFVNGELAVSGEITIAMR